MSCIFCKADIQPIEKLDSKINNKRAQILKLVFTKLSNLLRLKFPSRRRNIWNFKENSFPFCCRCRIEISKLCSLQDQIKLLEQQILKIIVKLYVLTIESEISNTANVSQKSEVNDRKDKSNTVDNQKNEVDYFRRAILRQFQANLILRDCKSELPEHCRNFGRPNRTQGHFQNYKESLRGSTIQHGDDVLDCDEENTKLSESFDGDHGNDTLDDYDIEDAEAPACVNDVQERFNSGEEDNSVKEKDTANETEDSGENDSHGVSTAESKSLKVGRSPFIINESEDNTADVKIEMSSQNLSDSDEEVDPGVSGSTKSSAQNASTRVKCPLRRTNNTIPSKQTKASKNIRRRSEVRGAATNKKPTRNKVTSIEKNLYKYQGYKMELQENKAICLACGVALRARDVSIARNYFRHHIKFVHQKKSYSPTGKVFLLDASTKKYTMDGFEFMEISDSDVRSFKCLTCNKDYVSKHTKFGVIGLHIRRRHMLSYKGVCTICGKTVNDLRTHKITVHSSHEHICEICGKVCKNNGTLILHLKTHQDPSEYEYQCEQCEKKFCQKQALESHMKMHAAKKEFVCDTCGKRFNFKHVLETHIASKHAKVRPFACNQCDWTFGVKFLLNRHIRQVHEGKKAPPPKKRKKVVVEAPEESSTSSAEDV